MHGVYPLMINSRVHDKLCVQQLSRIPGVKSKGSSSPFPPLLLHLSRFPNYPYLYLRFASCTAHPTHFPFYCPSVSYAPVMLLCEPGTVFKWRPFVRLRVFVCLFAQKLNIQLRIMM